MSRPRPDAVMLAHLIQSLCLQALDCESVAAITGMHVKTAARHLRDLHEHQKIHVGEWGVDARGYATVRKFRFGNLPDVPRPPPPTTSTERVREMRARRKEQT
jgi:hypothetical protein